MGRVLFPIMCLSVLVLGSSRVFADDTSASASSQVRPLSWEVFSLCKLVAGFSSGRPFAGGYVLGESRSLRSSCYSRLGVGAALLGGIEWAGRHGEGEHRVTGCVLPLRLYHVLRIEQEEDQVGFTWAFVEWSPWAATGIGEAVVQSERSGLWLKVGVAMEAPAVGAPAPTGLEAGIMVVPGLDGGRTDQFFYLQASFDLAISKLKGSE